MEHFLYQNFQFYLLLQTDTSIFANFTLDTNANRFSIFVFTSSRINQSARSALQPITFHQLNIADYVALLLLKFGKNLSGKLVLTVFSAGLQPSCLVCSQPIPTMVLVEEH